LRFHLGVLQCAATSAGSASPRKERPYVVILVGYPAADATVPTYALEKKPLEQILIRK
jgi:hypothetical protein